MFLILVRRELLANLITFRFLVAMVVTLSLVVANTVIVQTLVTFNVGLAFDAHEAQNFGKYQKPLV